MANLKDDLNKAKKNVAIATLVGGIAAFATGHYMAYLEEDGAISKKQKWIGIGIICAAIYSSGVSTRLNERIKLLEAIDSLDKN